MATLPRLIGELIDAIVLRGYNAAKAVSRDDFGVSKSVPDAVHVVSSHVTAAMKEAFRSDLERMALFTILFRTHADQARRMDAVDATLGVFFTALLVAGPLAFDRAPTLMDRWTAAVGFVTVILTIGFALFGIRGREPKPDIALLFARDLRTNETGSYDAVRRELNRLRKNPFSLPSPDHAIRRGAAGTIAELLARDRIALLAKRHILSAAVLLALLLTVIIGIRDVVYYASENRHELTRIPREAASHNVRFITADPRRR